MNYSKNILKVQSVNNRDANLFHNRAANIWNSLQDDGVLAPSVKFHKATVLT